MADTKKPADPRSAVATAEERLLNAILGERAPSSGVTAPEVEGGIDFDVLLALDVVSDTIEQRGEHWNAVLDRVEADLQTMLPANKEPAPSAA